MAPYRKKPAVVAPFPPLGYVKKQPVTPWDDWWTLRPFLKTEDPWDLIFFNFHTYDPDEVNWYLYEKVGCRGTSPNGRNYRFDSGDPHRALAIYLPQWDFRGPGPKQKEAQQTVLTILRGAVASHLSFNLGRVGLQPGDLLAVAAAIETRENHPDSPAHARAHGHLRLPTQPDGDQVVGIIRQCGDQGVGPLDAGGTQGGVVGGVADDRRQGHAGNPRRVAVDDDHVTTFALEVGRHGTTDATPAAQHDMLTQIGDPAVHTTPPIHLSKLSVDDHLHTEREGVQDRADADGDQHDREDLLGGVELDRPRGTRRWSPS